jgi:type I restriction enzyme S subunit
VSWRTVELQEVCDFQNGFAFKSNLFSESGLPILRISNIQNQKIDLNKLVYFKRDSYKEKLDQYKVEPNDLLIAMSGATTGKIGFNKTNETFYLNQRVGKLKPKTLLDKQYLYYFLSTQVEKNLSISAGAAQPNLSTEQIKGLLIPLPPLPIQQKIIVKLDAIFAEIDKATVAAEANAKNAEALFQSYLAEVFEGGGEGWERRQLSDIAKVVNGYAFKSGDFISENGIKCIKIANVGIRDFVCEANEFLPANYSIKHPNFLVSEGAIVIPLTRTIIGGGLKVAIVPKEFDGSLLNQRVAAINAIPSLMDGELIYFYLSSSIVSAYVLSNVNALMQPNLSIKDLLRMPIPVPPLKIQHDIKNDVDSNTKCNTV